jgi:hypothetical protein
MIWLGANREPDNGDLRNVTVSRPPKDGDEQNQTARLGQNGLFLITGL